RGAEAGTASMSDTRFLIRPAVPADSEALGRLGAMLMRAHYAFDRQRFIEPGDSPEEGYAWFLEAQARERDVIVLVAEQRDTKAVVGYVYAGLEPMSWKELRGPAGFVHDVATEPSVRRQGVE